MFRRNHYLVDNADLLLAAYDGQPGGTVMTCELVRCFDMSVILSAEAASDWLNVRYADTDVVKIV